MNNTAISKQHMRDAFFDRLYTIAKQDKRVILLVDDFGAPSLDKFRQDLVDQYYNIGISEQSMVSVAAGLALSNKIVYMYAIAPFVTLRCFEQIKIDLCLMNLPVTAVGVGAGFAYDTAGPTHHAVEDIAVMRILPNMNVFSPADSIAAAALAEHSYKMPGPKYIRLDRGKTPLYYQNQEVDFNRGLSVVKSGRDLYIIATGLMVGRALEVARELAQHSIDAGVIDVFCLKPFNHTSFLKSIEKVKKIVTLEEHLVSGGLGSIIAEVLLDHQAEKRLKRLAIADEQCFSYGDRGSLQAACGLDVDTIIKQIISWN